MDFAALVADEVARHRPRADYAQWDDVELVLNFAAVRAVGRACVIRIIHHAAADWWSVFKEADWIFHKLTLPMLAKLYATCQDARPLRRLVWLRKELVYLGAEITRRLVKRKVGLELVRAQQPAVPSQAVNALLRALRVERLTSYRPIDEDRDLWSLALLKAVEYYTRMGAAAARIPLPAEIAVSPPPIDGLPEEEPEPWRSVYPRLVTAEAEQLRRTLLPALRGETEKLPAKVRQALRDHWEARGAQKRAATVISLDDLAPEPTAEATPLEDLHQRVLRAYQEARRRWGPKAARFLDALAKGATVTEAARVAGISRKTGHKYLAELQKDPRLRDPA